mgnify:CR=1 FL=1
MQNYDQWKLDNPYGDEEKNSESLTEKDYSYLQDYDKIDNIVVDGIYKSDYPDFCDAFVESADYDGRELTGYELDLLNEDSEFVYKCVQAQLF